MGGPLEHLRKEDLDLRMIELFSRRINDRRGMGQLRYIAATDAKEIYETRMQVGDEAFRKAMAQQFSLLKKQSDAKRLCGVAKKTPGCRQPFRVLIWIANAHNLPERCLGAFGRVRYGKPTFPRLGNILAHDQSRVVAEPSGLLSPSGPYVARAPIEKWRERRDSNPRPPA